jgi:hypothetical protein
VAPGRHDSNDQPVTPGYNPGLGYAFAINAAEKLNEHGEKAQVVIIDPT